MNEKNLFFQQQVQLAFFFERTGGVFRFFPEPQKRSTRPGPLMAAPLSWLRNETGEINSFFDMTRIVKNRFAQTDEGQCPFRKKSGSVAMDLSGVTISPNDPTGSFSKNRKNVYLSLWLNAS